MQACPAVHEGVAAYWASLKGARALPRRIDISAAAIKTALPYVTLIDVIRDGADFRYRLLGQHLVEVYGRNLTGMLQSEFATEPGAAIQPVRDAYRRCIQTRLPVRWEADFYGPDGVTPRRMLAQVCPLSDTGERVDCLLGTVVFQTSDVPNFNGPAVRNLELAAVG